MSGSFPKDSSGTSPDGNSFNRLVVTVQGKEVQINGEKILEEIQKGNLISAIKILRQETGFGLKESKDLIDALGKVHPTKK